MTVNTSSDVSLLESVLTAQKTHADISVTVLKKAQDVATQQGQAMIEVLEQSGVTPDSRIDTYA